MTNKQWEGALGLAALREEVHEPSITNITPYIIIEIQCM